MLNKSESKIFVPYKALGYVCDKTPFCLKYNERLKQYYVVAALSNTIHLYKCKGLRLVSVSKPLPTDITCLASDNVFIYASCKSILYKLHLVRNIVKTFSGHDDDIIFILPFGTHVITVDHSSQVIVSEIETLEIYTKIQFDPKTFKVSAILHPHTYVNKILFGSTQGTLELWNIKSHKKIYTFEGWSSKVNTIEQTSAIDVVGIGLENGQIKIHNLKFDQTIVSFQQEWGPVVALSFRTDGPTTFVGGSGNGCLALWDLNEQKLVSQIRDTHKVEGNVLNICFVPLQPLLVTSSSDNSLKVWNFDKGDNTANLLYVREGHHSPIYRIRYHGSNGENILTSGSDGSFRVFSLIHDGKNKVFARRCRDGKKLGRKKKRKLAEALTTNDGMDDPSKSSAFAASDHSILLPLIIHFASESSRQRDWDDVLCCHKSFPYATTWSFYDGSVGRHLLKPPPFCTESKSKGDVDGQLAAGTSVCAVTSCANFALVGYESGHVDKFNMQSGVYRGSFAELPPNPKAKMASDRGAAHPGKCISLLHVDRFNKITVTGAGADRVLKFWTFSARKLCANLSLASSPTRANSLNRDSSLLAVGLEDFTIVVIDLVTRQLIRNLIGHESTLTDMVLKWDSRWLISAGMDGCLKTWDIPSGSLIDVARTQTPIVSLDLSAGQNLLATAHLGRRGLYLWSDRTAYSYVPLTEISERSADYHAQMNGVADNSSCFGSGRKLITLSDLPLTYPRSVVYYDRVKARNRGGLTSNRTPPDAIPFFITGGHNVSEQKYFSSQIVPKRGQILERKSFREPIDPELDGENVEKTLVSFANRTDFGEMLLAYLRAKNNQPPPDLTLSHSELMKTLSNFGPSSGNYELELLSPLNQAGSSDPLLAFLAFLKHAFQTGANYEIAQTYLNLLIKLHFQTIVERSELLEAFLELAELQTDSWNRLERDFLQCQSLISCLKNPFN